MLKKKIVFIFVFLIIIIISGYLLIKKPRKEVSITEQNFEEKGEYEKYLIEGLNYRTAGFQGDVSAFYKAIESYKKAVEISEGKAWVPYLNLGNTYRLVKDFENAEEAYNQALEIAPGEWLIYAAKIEMMRFDQEKSNEEIKTLYREALEVVFENKNLIISYAAFLRDIKDYLEAKKYYEILAEKDPDNQLYKNEIKELNEKIK